MAVGKGSIQRAVKANSNGKIVEQAGCEPTKVEDCNTVVLANPKLDYTKIFKNEESVKIGNDLPDYLL